MAASKTCPCGQPCETGRCNKCGAAAVRCTRFLKDKDDEFKDNFKNALKKNKRAEFMASIHDKFGSELGAMIDHTVQEYRESLEIWSWKGTGEFVEINDLRNKLKDNPSKLQAIENTVRSSLVLKRG